MIAALEESPVIICMVLWERALMRLVKAVYEFGAVIMFAWLAVEFDMFLLTTNYGPLSVLMTEKGSEDSARLSLRACKRVRSVEAFLMT